MKTRLITAGIAAALFLPFLIFSGTPAFIVFAVLANIISVFEMIKCIHLQKNLFCLISAEVYGIVAAIFSRIGNNRIVTFAVITIAYVVINLIVSMFSKEKYSLTNACKATLLTVGVVFGYLSLIFIRDLPYGKYAIWLVIIGSWLSDSGAYFVGTFFGKHKLCPDISPKKTWEGLFGGVFFCLIFFLIYGDLVTIFAKDYHANLWLLMICGAVVAAVSVFGDLLASYIKRAHKVKDYGKILPGHGGFLDRFDSLLAASVTLWAFCLITSGFPIFVANQV